METTNNTFIEKYEDQEEPRLRRLHVNRLELESSIIGIIAAPVEQLFGLYLSFKVATKDVNN